MSVSKTQLNGDASSVFAISSGSIRNMWQLSNLKWDLVREFDSDRKAYMAGKSALCEEINRKAFGDRWTQVRTDR